MKSQPKARGDAHMVKKKAAAKGSSSADKSVKKSVKTASTKTVPLPPVEPVAPPLLEAAVGVVPDGKVVDFLTGKFFNDTPEEYVRQNVEKAIVRQYRYAAKDCWPEFRIKVASSTKRADIAVFRKDAPHTQANVHILVEAKKPGANPHAKKDGIEQLQAYMAVCVNAQYGLWTNGDERYCFAKRIKDEEVIFEQIIDIPAFGQSEEDAQRPKRKDLKPATGDNLLFAFRRSHNYIAGQMGLQKPEAFWELLKLIFCKIEDERSSQLQFFVTPKERSNPVAAGATKTRIQKIFDEKVLKKYSAIFGEKERIIDLKPDVLAYVVGELQGFSLLLSPVDVKGIAYEEVVGSNLRGDRGEFFTPRNACRMAVAMLDPRPTERLLDPACGTGGFLIIAMNHALAHIEREERINWNDPSAGSDEEREELYRKRIEYFREKTFGLDLNPALVRAAKMNMVMNNDGSANVHQANSLEDPHTWDNEPQRKIKLGSIDVLFTNPPFGANILIENTHILRQYDLAAVWDKQEDGSWRMRKDEHGDPVLQKAQPPEILFIERCIQFLSEGKGRMAIVLPNGILNNPALGYVRLWLRHNTQILGVVDMARELFQPKNDTQTSMVFLRRLSAEERDRISAGKADYPLFMAVAEKVGKNKRGKTIYRRTETGEEVVVKRIEEVTEIDRKTGVEVTREVEVQDRLIDDELPEVASAYAKWKSEPT